MRYVEFERHADPQLLLTATAGEKKSPLPQIGVWWGQEATWVWDELERTDNGGIEMKVARQEIYQLPKPTDKSGHHPHPRVRYVVRADPWGHIIEIKQDVEQTK